MSKVLFLDRDGIINIDYGYVNKKEDFDFVDGIFNLCREAQEKGYKIIVITNQSGIARGMYSENDFHKLNNWMIKEFKNNQIKIEKTYYCPHHPKKGIGEYLKDCNCRKPNAGMILESQKEFNVNLKESIMIGDKISDMEVAKNADIGTKILFNESLEVELDFKIKRVSSLKEINFK